MKTKKKISKKTASKRKAGRPATGYTIKVPLKFKGQDPRVEFHQPPRKDVEDDALEPQDEFANHKYPPPKKHPVFRRMWGLFIDNISARSNFHLGHLETLRVLCNYYVEYEDLEEYIRKNGRSYCSVGRAGEVWKLYPEVNQLNRVREGIQQYSKMLGLILKKDEGDAAQQGEDDAAWT